MLWNSVTEEPDARVGARMVSCKKFVSTALGSVKIFPSVRSGAARFSSQFQPRMIRKHGNPIRGVKGAKPKLPDNGKAEVSELSRQYLEVRNRQMHAKTFVAETMAAERRGQLIAKDLVLQQAAYLLVALRQQILNLPQTYARRILGLTDAGQAAKILREMSISVLNEIKNLPQQVTDPNWLEELE
jgi:hypothetical protein